MKLNLTKAIKNGDDYLIHFMDVIKYFCPEEKLNYKPYVLFSGGFDSTSVLLNLCKMKQLGMIEDKITCIAIEGCELDSKNNKEKETRYKIIEEIKKEFSFTDDDIEYFIAFKIYCDYFDSSRTGYNLQHLYINAAIEAISSKSLLFLGYNMEEGGIAYKFSHLQSMVDNICAFYDHADTRLIPALARFTKADIIENLLMYYPKFYDYCWTCQNPHEVKKGNKIRYVPCLKCPKCKEVINSLNTIKHKYDIQSVRQLNGLKNSILHNIEKQKKEYEENKQKEVKETIDDSEKVKVNFDK